MVLYMTTYYILNLMLYFIIKVHTAIMFSWVKRFKNINLKILVLDACIKENTTFTLIIMC